ncbi:MAG: hypothetical protein IT325_13405 [Anaerolineae bacterium]|nr:hypothetical protein [Anaerolineae bacterium]
MSTYEELRQAYTLIKQEQIDEALALLRPIVVNEPENVDAWWLLANAAIEPDEAREALIQVLRLDPDYANAPKAGEMLDKLNEHFPPVPDELDHFPELRPAAVPLPEEEELFGIELGDSFPETAASAQPFVEEAFDDPFALGSFDAIDLDEELFEMGEDPFAELDEDPFALDAAEAPVAPERREPVRFVTFGDEPQPLDAEAHAAAEERAARQRGRGGRILGALVGLLLVAVMVVALVWVLLPVLEPKVKDLAALSAVDLDGNGAAAVQAATEQLQVAALPAEVGTPQVVLANSALGPTLFVQACARPTPTLPQLIEQMMQLAAQQAASLQGQEAIRAVGVNITRCGSDPADTLYRAAVPIGEAANYVGLQPGDPRWPEFQSRWD